MSNFQVSQHSLAQYHTESRCRGIGYFIEALFAIAPFGKVGHASSRVQRRSWSTQKPLQATFTGITNCDSDPSVDFIRLSMFPLAKRFGIDEGLLLKVKKRGAPPLGGGEVSFNCPTVRQLRPVQITDAGFVKKIRLVPLPVAATSVGLTLLVALQRGGIFIEGIATGCKPNRGVRQGAAQSLHSGCIHLH